MWEAEKAQERERPVWVALKLFVSAQHRYADLACDEYIMGPDSGVTCNILYSLLVTAYGRRRLTHGQPLLKYTMQGRVEQASQFCNWFSSRDIGAAAWLMLLGRTTPFAG